MQRLHSQHLLLGIRTIYHNIPPGTPCTIPNIYVLKMRSTMQDTKYGTQMWLLCLGRSLFGVDLCMLFSSGLQIMY